MKEASTESRRIVPQTVREMNTEGEQIDRELLLIRERILTILVDGIRAGSVSCTPDDLEALVYGWLLSEGIIGQASDAETVRIETESMTASVSLCEAHRQMAAQQRERKAVRQCEVQESEAADAGKCWSAEEIFFLQDRFAADPPLHEKTRAAHSCMIARKVPGRKPQVLYRSEDAGRHSALDKAIGWALLQGVDLSECMLFTSGRISTRMMQKAVRAKAGALAGKGTVTAEAQEMAAEYGVCLIGYVRPDSAVLFSAGARPDGI